MKLIGVALLAFGVGICLGSENRISSNRLNGHVNSQAISGISDFANDRGLNRQGNGFRQPENELTNNFGTNGITGIPGFVYEAGLRQEGNGFIRQENAQKTPVNGLTNNYRSSGIDGVPSFTNGGESRQEGNEIRRQNNGFQGQAGDSNSVNDEKNILTQRFQYQDVQASPSPDAMSHFQIPGIKHSSQVSNFQSQRNGEFDQASNIAPLQQVAQQGSSATRFQESEIRQTSSDPRFPASEIRQFSESSDLRTPSQQFSGPEPELRARPSFPPSIPSTFETSKIKESSQSIRFDSQSQGETHPFRQSEKQTKLTQTPTSAFPLQPSEQKRVQGSSEFTSQIKDETLAQTRQPQLPAAQKADTRGNSDFQATLQRPGSRQPFESTPEIPQTISQFPQAIESTRTQVSETRQPLRPSLQDENNRNQFSQTQESFSAQETETDSQQRFSAKPSVTQFQAPGIRQSPEPTRLHSVQEDTRRSQDQHRQSQLFSQQETETRDRPQLSPSPVPQVPSPHGQSFQSQQFATQETDVTSQPRFPTQDPRLPTQQLSHQQIETRARPQFPPQSVTKVSDANLAFKEEKETERQTFQSQETDVRAQTRFPSVPSAFQETRQPSAATDALKFQREEAALTTQDQRFPAQQITSIESEKKTSTRFSSPQVSHFQAAGTQQQQQKPFRPIVRQESFPIPPRFQTNLFRDVGYASPPVHNRPNVALVKSHTIGPTDEGSYAFTFESEDGIIREEQGGYTEPDKGLTAKTGSFSYISPDGTIVETTYIADERGYRTQSSPLARIHDPDLPAGKYDRFRSALASSQRNAQSAVNKKTEQETRVRF